MSGLVREMQGTLVYVTEYGQIDWPQQCIAAPIQDRLIFMNCPTQWETPQIRDR